MPLPSIQYAVMAMGDTLRGIFPAGQIIPNWDEFVKELKPKFIGTCSWIPNSGTCEVTGLAASQRYWRTNCVLIPYYITL